MPRSTASKLTLRRKRAAAALGALAVSLIRAQPPGCRVSSPTGHRQDDPWLVAVSAQSAPSHRLAGPPPRHGGQLGQIQRLAPCAPLLAVGRCATAQYLRAKSSRQAPPE